MSENQPGTIFLHANWLYYENRLSSLTDTIKALKSGTPGSDIVIVGGVPQWKPSLPIYFVERGLKLKHSPQSLDLDKFDEIHRVNSTLREIAGEMNVKFKDPLQYLCSKSQRCLVSVIFGGKPALTAWDYGHLTKAGSAFLATRLLAD